MFGNGERFLMMRTVVDLSDRWMGILGLSDVNANGN